MRNWRRASVNPVVNPGSHLKSSRPLAVVVAVWMAALSRVSYGEAFETAVENVRPLLEVRSKRVGGATYQVPTEVSRHRGTSLAIRWIIQNAHARTDHTFGEKFAAEIIAASRNEGGAVKKREDTHKMAEANKAFAHYRW